MLVARKREQQALGRLLMVSDPGSGTRPVLKPTVYELSSPALPLPPYLQLLCSVVLSPTCCQLLFLPHLAHAENNYFTNIRQTDFPSVTSILIGQKLTHCYGAACDKHSLCMLLCLYPVSALKALLTFIYLSFLRFLLPVHQLNMWAFQVWGAGRQPSLAFLLAMACSPVWQSSQTPNQWAPLQFSHGLRKATGQGLLWLPRAPYNS